MKKQYLKALLLSLCLISSGAFSAPLPKQCPSLAQVISEYDMRLENWNVSHYDDGYNLYDFSISYGDYREGEDVFLSIANVAAQSKEEALQKAYNIIKEASNDPIQINGSGNWMLCTYKTSDGYHLNVSY